MADDDRSRPVPAKKSEMAEVARGGVGEIVKGAFAGSLRDPHGAIAEIMDRVIATYPPQMGLKYITGIWRIPWLVSQAGHTHDEVSVLKYKIANDPNGELALAYALGVEDGGNGKGNWRKHLKKHPMMRVEEVTPQWYAERGLGAIIEDRTPVSDPMAKQPPRDPMKPTVRPRVVDDVCARCRGTGQLDHQLRPMSMTPKRLCPVCRGTGRVKAGC